jgi:hypothetical protein
VYVVEGVGFDIGNQVLTGCPSRREGPKTYARCQGTTFDKDIPPSQKGHQ